MSDHQPNLQEVVQMSAPFDTTKTDQPDGCTFNLLASICCSFSSHFAAFIWWSTCGLCFKRTCLRVCSIKGQMCNSELESLKRELRWSFFKASAVLHVPNVEVAMSILCSSKSVAYMPRCADASRLLFMALLQWAVAEAT
eukprot:3237715-Amphidinium_carterae.1